MRCGKENCVAKKKKGANILISDKRISRDTPAFSKVIYSIYIGNTKVI